MANPLWIFFTLAASVAQVARNAMQRDLTEQLGSLGAAYVRFVYGAPFALIFLAFAILAAGRAVAPDAAAVGWTALGAGAQIGATALMLAAMRARSFVVVTAYVKTEPVLAALFGFFFLQDALSAGMILAIAVAVAGVLLLSLTPRAGGEAQALGARFAPAGQGVASAALFALSAVAFRAAILRTGADWLAATTILALTLALQCAAIGVWLAVFDRPGARKIAAAWRPSLFAGFIGALGSQFWFLAFSMQSAAMVRTLALVEAPMAQIVSRNLFRERTGAREYAGVGLILLGVALLLGGL